MCHGPGPEAAAVPGPGSSGFPVPELIEARDRTFIYDPD